MSDVVDDTKVESLLNQAPIASIFSASENAINKWLERTACHRHVNRNGIPLGECRLKGARMRVLITGANRGIGRALYDGYAARGDNVTGTTRSQASGDWLQLDVTDPTSVSAMAIQFESQPLDLLICNAGVYLDKDNELGTGYGANIWAETFAANVTGVFLTIEALLPNLRAVGGKVAIISSQMGSSERAGGNAFVYRASKAAALNLGRNLAAELSPDVAVGIYHPGWVQTDMGGAKAAITVDESATGLIQRFDVLGPTTTGCFEMWNGEAMPY